MTAPLTPGLDARALVLSLLNEALHLLGATAMGTLPPQPRPGLRQKHLHGWDTKTIAAALRAFVAREGRPPKIREWSQTTRHSLPPRPVVVGLYGSLEAAYQAHGFVYPPSRRGVGTGREGGRE